MINEEDNLTHIKPECDINSQLAVVLEKLEMSGYSDEVRQEKKDYENPQQKGDSRYIFDPELMESFKKEKKSVNSSIELRPFKMEDVEACYEVYKLFALETSIPLNQGCMDFWRHVTYKAILINIPYSIVAIDTDTSLIVGFIGAEFRENADYLCHFLQIKCLAVHPMFRGMRIAKTLVSALGCVARTLEAPYLVYIFKNRTNRLFERILLKIGFTTVSPSVFSGTLEAVLFRKVGEPASFGSGKKHVPRGKTEQKRAQRFGHQDVRMRIGKLLIESSDFLREMLINEGYVNNAPFNRP